MIAARGLLRRLSQHGLQQLDCHHRYGIAWRTFFERLGREVVLDAPSDRGTLEVGGPPLGR